MIPGATAPRLVTKEMISKMRRGSAVVDVAVDQGGCFETTVHTNLDNPTFVVDGVIHYCVPNMPNVVASDLNICSALATFPYVLKLANSGYQKALRSDVSLYKGLDVYKGKVTNKAVADSLCLEYAPFEALL